MPGSLRTSREPRYRPDDVRSPGGGRLRRRAEEMGFGAIWSAETRHDPFLPLAVASTTTSRRPGTAIAVAFPRSPMVLAHIAWTCRVRRRPLQPGPGPQVKAHNERRFSCPGSPRGHGSARSSRRCGRSGTAGRAARRSTPRALLPLQSHDALLQPGTHRASAHPIYLAGVNPQMCRIAGRSRTACTSTPSTARATCASACTPRCRRAQPQRRSRADFTFRASTMVVLGDLRRSCAGTRGR
jgi:alkanesulfonate monooxygenase SsuD/methylene tetrahydromethanopterin reductase-like flavin-dependent oxidoreductase (luciferase family)